MGLDLITQRNCSIKEQIDQFQLLNQIKERNRGNSILKMLISNGKSEAEALQTEFTQVLQTPGGNEEVKVQVGELLSKTAHLKNLGKECDSCPIAGGKPFGCVEYISYPISKRSEQWLAQIAENASAKGAPFNMTLIFITDQNINGQRIAEMRAHGNTFFEDNEPTKINMQNGTINSDQLLDVIFLDGVMQRTHMQYLLMLFGGIVSDLNKPDDRPYAINQKDQKYVYLDLILPDDADKSMRELYNYCQHLFLALVYGHDVWMN